VKDHLNSARTAGPEERTPPTTTLWRNGRLTTLHGLGRWDPLDNWVLVTAAGSIQWLGPLLDLPPNYRQAIDHERDLHGRLVTPGLIDCHTHLVYAGQRDLEFEQRLQGVSYEEIARRGGGIRATVAATRAASAAELLTSAVERAHALRSGGVTTVEIKSGYGLDFATESRCLQVARQVAAIVNIDVRVTCLAAHTVPPEYDGRGDDYVAAVCQWLPIWQAEGWLDAVDVFCERVGLSLPQTRRVLACAAALGLPVKCHAEQLSLLGGAALAAEFGALSCDHLEYLDAVGIAAMKAAGSTAVLLPGAYYSLRQAVPPPVAALRQAGVPIAVATDHNPGSSPLLSLPLAGNLACTLFGLTPQEAVAGMTVHAARALGLSDRGTLDIGKRSHLAIWNFDHPREIVYWLASEPADVSTNQTIA